MELLTARLAEALARPWTGFYVRVLAIVLLYGASVHVGSMLGWSGRPWLEMPLRLRLMDVVLLIFNLVSAAGLWLRTSWSVLLLFAGILLLQVVPYTLFRSYFIESPKDAATLNGLLATLLLLLAVLVGLVLAKK